MRSLGIFALQGGEVQRKLDAKKKSNVGRSSKLWVLNRYPLQYPLQDLRRSERQLLSS